MQDDQDGMVEQHSGAGVPHDGPNLLSPLRLVTMAGAFGACRFGFLKRASLKALIRVLEQSLALRAERMLRLMFTSTIEVNHCIDRPLLSSHSRVWLAHTLFSVLFSLTHPAD